MARRFNPRKPVNPDGEHWIEAFNTRAGNGILFGYEAEHILPCNIRDVWTTLQQIEYFENWFNGSGKRQLGDDSSEEFGPGDRLGERHGTVIDYSETSGMVFRHDDAFFILTLKDYGPAATHAKLRCFDYNEEAPNWLSRMIQERNRNNKDQSGRIASTRHRLIKLGHLTQDLKLFDRPIPNYARDDEPLSWIEWRTTDGTLHVLPDENGARMFEVGQSVRVGKIAYVVPDHLRASEEPERYYIEKWSIQANGDCRIVRVSKNHGDPVIDGDRILLLES